MTLSVYYARLASMQKSTIAIRSDIGHQHTAVSLQVERGAINYFFAPERLSLRRALPLRAQFLRFLVHSLQRSQQ
jgi:hypothetical protein